MRRLLNALPLVLSLVTFAAARAEEHLNIDWREAQIIRLGAMAASVVIGDPTVVDVSLEDPHTLILFGKSPGETNLLVFGSDHKLILTSSVTVSPETERHVSVYGSPDNTAAETLFSCGSRCVRVLSPTDIKLSSIKASAPSKPSSSQNAAGQSSVDESSGGADTSTTIPVSP